MEILEILNTIGLFIIKSILVALAIFLVVLIVSLLAPSYFGRPPSRKETLTEIFWVSCIAFLSAVPVGTFIIGHAVLEVEYPAGVGLIFAVSLSALFGILRGAAIADLYSRIRDVVKYGYPKK